MSDPDQMELEKLLERINLQPADFDLTRYVENETPKFFEYKIIVPDEKTKQEMMKVFKYIHDLSEIDTDYILVNQLVHEYQNGRNVEVSK